MATNPFDYKASVEERGGYFFTSIPANAPVDDGWKGEMGARFPKYSATGQYTYEVAPPAVRLAAAGVDAWQAFVGGVSVYAANSPIPTFSDDVEYAKQQWQKAKNKVPDLNLLDLLAAAVGIPKELLLLALVVAVYFGVRHIIKG